MGSLLTSGAVSGVVPAAVGPSDDSAVAALVATDGSATATAVIKRGSGSFRSVNVRDYGAVPAGSGGTPDATNAIQSAIDAVAVLGGGEVVVDDSYWVTAHVPGTPGHAMGDTGGIGLKDGIHLRFTAKGELKVIPNGEPVYNCVRIYDKSSVRVSGPGRITGDLPSHTGSDSNGEWGYGIAIVGGTNISIEDVTITSMWGDGIDVNIVPGSGKLPKSIRVSNVTCDGNRRQGMSIEAGDGILVTNSRFINTGASRGTLPSNGIDIEPAQHSYQCSSIEIRSCRFEANAGFGCSVYMAGTRDVLVDSCEFVDNKGDHQFIVSESAGANVRLTRSRFTGTAKQCVTIAGGLGRVITDNFFDRRVQVSYNSAKNVAKNVVIARNRFLVNATDVISGLVEVNQHAVFTEILDNHFEHQGTRGSGVLVRYAGTQDPAYPLQHVKVERNTFVNTSNAVIAGDTLQLNIVDNTIHACASDAINLAPAHGVVVRGNRITGANLVSGSAAIHLTAGTTDTTIEGNRIEKDPAVTVTETRRGTHAYAFDWAAISNTIIRNTDLIGGQQWHFQLPTSRTGCYFETVPGTWV